MAADAVGDAQEAVGKAADREREEAVLVGPARAAHLGHAEAVETDPQSPGAAEGALVLQPRSAPIVDAACFCSLSHGMPIYDIERSKQPSFDLGALDVDRSPHHLVLVIDAEILIGSRDNSRTRNSAPGFSSPE